MKIKKIILLLIAVPMAEVIIACCNCGDTETYNYTYGELSVTNIDNSDAEAVESTAIEISKRAYGIRLNFTTNMAALRREASPLFLSSAHATNCGCPPPYWSEQNITSFKIFAINAFDDSHGPGTDVSEYFKTFKYDSYWAPKDITGKNYISEGSFDSRKNIVFDFLLMQENSFKSQQFRVELVLSDGRRHELITSPVNLI